MEKSNDICERLYWAARLSVRRFLPFLRTAVIRVRKFIALPYCYFRFVNWEECSKSRLQVALDFLYIFFKLKFYPENYGYCRLWEKSRDSWKYYYGSNYDAYQSHRLGKEVQKKEYEILFKDKEVCHQMCIGAGLPVPKVFGVLDPKENYISKLRDLLNSHEKLIIKPVIGRGGHGVQLLRRVNGLIFSGDNREEFDLMNFLVNERYLVQEFLEQDDRLSLLTSSASIRVTTFYTMSGDIIPLQSDIITAVDNKIVSNWSSGGISIGINFETGRLNEAGYDKQGRKYFVHPTSAIKFSDYVIPDWNEIVEFAFEIQRAFPFFRILGPDITLSRNGPMIYEINATPDLGAGEQSNGPLLADKKVFDAFRQYDLLINNSLGDKIAG